MKLSKNQTGFAVVEALLIFVIVAIIGGSGYYVYSANKKTNETFDAASKSAQSTVPKSKTTTKKQSSETTLKISEWKIAITLTEPIKDATYHLGENQYAYLSTKKLDESAACKEYYGENRSFQVITRHLPSDKLDFPEDDGSYKTVEEATKTMPEGFKKLGGYVYQFSKGNGTVCDEQAGGETAAFSAAFQTLRTEQ